MPGHELGVNPVEAYSSGQDAEAYASGFTGLGDDFDAALQTAKTACKHDPEVKGWDAYGEEQAAAIAKVENHGISLAENIHGGAADVATTDHEAAESYDAVAHPLNRPPNVSLA